jgi:hypothetical protein
MQPLQIGGSRFSSDSCGIDYFSDIKRKKWLSFLNHSAILLQKYRYER